MFERLQERVEGDGTGVGLAVCRKIAEHLGGSAHLVEVPSGARAQITFPAAVVRRRGAAVMSGA